MFEERLAMTHFVSKDHSYEREKMELKERESKRN